MKTIRITLALLVCVVLCLCLAPAGYAEGDVLDSGTCGAKGDNLTWTLYDTGELVIEGTGAMANYNEGTAPWYTNRVKITSAVIGDSVTSIGNYAFSYCIKLEAIEIARTVTSVGEYVFDHCTKLTNIALPDSVTSIYRYAFSGCSSLTSITLPEDVRSIAHGTFSGCSSLTSIILPEGLTSIDSSAFSNCSNLTSITVPEGVTSISYGAFSGCSSLTSITLPESVRNVGECAFERCNSLTSITLPEGVRSIGQYTFSACSSLVSIVLPETVTSIGRYAFSGCTRLTGITLPKGVASIGYCAFNGCSSLTSITLSEGVTSIDGSAFSDCSSLASITIPEGVTMISWSAFSGCSSLTSITLPESVTRISDNAFRYCSKLTDVYYGGSEEQWKLIEIGSYNAALLNATIHYGTIPALYTVSYDANGGTGAPERQTKTEGIVLTLSEVQPTRAKTSAGSYTVRLNPNDGSRAVSILRAVKTTSYAFRSWNTEKDGSGTDYAPGANYSTDADLTLYARWDSTTTTTTLTLPELARTGAVFFGWAEDKDAESGISGEYTPTADITLYAIWAQADLLLPASLAGIEAEAFAGGAFTYVLVPETVTEIGPRAFAGCPNLRYVELLKPDTAIDRSAFEGVSGLAVIGASDATAAAFEDVPGISFRPAA